MRASIFKHFNLLMRATSLLVFTCYFVLPSLNEDFTYLLTYLAIFITNNLSWNKHCANNCKQANANANVWNQHMKCNVDKIEMVQRHAARFVCHDYSRYSHVSTMINALGWNNEDWTTKCVCSIKSIMELLALLYLLK